MPIIMYTLRQIGGVTDSGKYTFFVAMTDDEFNAFRRSNTKTLAPFLDRVLHTVRGDAPSEQDIRDATAAFTHRYMSGPHGGVLAAG